MIVREDASFLLRVESYVYCLWTVLYSSLTAKTALCEKVRFYASRFAFDWKTEQENFYGLSDFLTGS